MIQPMTQTLTDRQVPVKSRAWLTVITIVTSIRIEATVKITSPIWMDRIFND